MKKNIKVIGYGLWVMVALLVSAPITAQNNQEWQTSTMQGSGSQYSSQVTPVGSTVVANEATTTENNAPAKAPTGRRKIDVYTPTGDPNAPVGDAMLPMLLCAVVFCGVIYFRRKHYALKS